MQHDFILLDRSRSMVGLWTEMIGSVNTYVEKLAAEKVDTGVTLAVFDTDNGKFCFEIVRDRITPTTWRKVIPNEVRPRGMTPLNDATMKIVSLAETGPYDKVAIIIATDGYENNSREFTVAQVKAKLDVCRAKNWQVIFFGANFDNQAQALSYGTMSQNTIQSSVSNLGQTMCETAVMRASYGTTGQAMNYTAEQKTALKKN